jgi:predicted molibdopterin-dependent oxidoreductase YjgC
VDPGIASGTADVFLLRRRDTLPDLAPAGLRVVIDSEPRVLPAGISVLDALHSVGIDVPTLCHDERLVPSGACRLCLVRIAGWPRLMPACTTTLAEGMEISTHTPEILDFRRFVLRSLATFHTTAALLNAVTSPYRDAVVGTPEYKVTAVRLERLPTGSQSDAA